MTALTFDTLKYANRLKAANVPAAQAEAEAEALSEVLEVNMKDLATKDDLRAMEARTDAKLEKLGLSLTVKLGSIVVMALGAFTVLTKWIS